MVRSCPSTRVKGMMNAQVEADVEKSWHAKFPSPKSVADSISREELLQMLQNDDKTPGRDFLTVDLRRNDHEGSTIQGSMNFPAQSLWHALDTLYELCAAAGVSLVIFYCGSSNGRGNRAAGWFQDTLVSRSNSTMKSLVLRDGIDGWFRAGEQYTKFVQGNGRLQGH